MITLNNQTTARRRQMYLVLCLEYIYLFMSVHLIFTFNSALSSSLVPLPFLCSLSLSHEINGLMRQVQTQFLGKFESHFGRIRMGADNAL